MLKEVFANSWVVENGNFLMLFVAMSSEPLKLVQSYRDRQNNLDQPMGRLFEFSVWCGS